MSRVRETLRTAARAIDQQSRKKVRGEAVKKDALVVGNGNTTKPPDTNASGPFEKIVTEKFDKLYENIQKRASQASAEARHFRKELRALDPIRAVRKNPGILIRQGAKFLRNITFLLVMFSLVAFVVKVLVDLAMDPSASEQARIDAKLKDAMRDMAVGMGGQKPGESDADFARRREMYASGYHTVMAEQARRTNLNNDKSAVFGSFTLAMGLSGLFSLSDSELFSTTDERGVSEIL